MEYTTKKFPFLLVLSFIFVLGVGLGYGYYISQANVLADEKVNLDRQVAEINNQLKDLKSSDIISAQTAVNALDTIGKSEVQWSEVLQGIIAVAPIDQVEVRALVEFTSYSGGEDGRLTLNARTYASRDTRDLLNSVAKTIDAFNENPDFGDAFVPSVSKSVSEDDQTVLSFILNVNYAPSYAEEEGEGVPRR